MYFKENILSFHCSFLHGLRQNIETRGSKSTAVMNDFVIPTAKVPSFEVHSMTLSELDAFAIETNELVVCERSPTQESLMWKKFEKIARGLDGDRDSDETGTEAMVLTEMSLHAQEICDAILKSIRLGCVNVDLI